MFPGEVCDGEEGSSNGPIIADPILSESSSTRLKIKFDDMEGQEHKPQGGSPLPVVCLSQSGTRGPMHSGADQGGTEA